MNVNFKAAEYDYEQPCLACYGSAAWKTAN